MTPRDLTRLLAARRRRGLVALFDFDGTLAPIARRPALARIAPRTRAALRALARRDDTLVGIVSGRRVTEVRRRVAIPSLWIAGVHGAERAPPTHRAQRLWSPMVEREARGLERPRLATFTSVRGVRVERKGPVVAVHARGLRAPTQRLARRSAARRRPPGWELLEGRRVTELVPPGLPDKASAVRWLAAQRRGAIVLYIGDDTTDEPAFRAVAPHGFAICVSGHRARAERRARTTAATTSLPNVTAVTRLIRQLAHDDFP